MTFEEQSPTTRAGNGLARAEAGFGLIGMLVSLIVLGGIGLIVVNALGPSTSVPTVTINGAPPAKTTIAQTPAGVITVASGLAAQASLRAALSVVDEAAITAGGYGVIDVASLSAGGAGSAFISGASSSPSQVSIAASGGAGGGVTLAARAASGDCWLIWRSVDATRYGLGRHMVPCSAPALAATPPSATGDASIVWQPSSFPSP